MNSTKQHGTEVTEPEGQLLAIANTKALRAPCEGRSPCCAALTGSSQDAMKRFELLSLIPGWQEDAPVCSERKCRHFEHLFLNFGLKNNQATTNRNGN